MAAAAGPKAGIIDVNDLRSFLRIFSKNWYFVVVALILIGRPLLPVLLQDPRGVRGQHTDPAEGQGHVQLPDAVYQNIGYVAAYGDIVNQKRVLTSYDMISRALDKLDFDVSYYIIGRFKKTEVYGGLPFTVKMRMLNKPKLYEKPFDLHMVDPDHFELSYDRGAGIVKKTFPFDTDIADGEDGDFTLRVDKVKRSQSSTWRSSPLAITSSWCTAEPWLGEQVQDGMTVENLEYTTILEMRVEDEIPLRAKMFLDTLSRGVHRLHAQSEFDINENARWVHRQADRRSER
jgi:hypothetical protein